MAANINLFPPIMLDSMPAFLRNSQCRIYFALSNYTSESDVKGIHITLVNQSSNKNAFSSSYPIGIKNATIQTDTTKQNQGDDYCYYITISPSDLASGNFGLDQFYKVQLRFSSIAGSNPITATWINSNLDKFSEWSNICLIRGISNPTITLMNGQLTQGSSSSIADLSILTGKLSFSESSETQYLKSYKVKIYNSGGSTVLWDSDIIYADNYAVNQINTPIPWKLNRGTSYVLKFSYTTNNSYTPQSELQYPFTISGSSGSAMKVTIAATANQNIGGIQVNIKAASGASSSGGTFIIRRSSSQSNFTLYDDIKFTSYTRQSQINYTLKDTTIESNIWYKYEVSKVESNGRTTPVEMNDPVMCVFEGMFLTTKDAQLKILFNGSLGDFKYNVTESQQVTLGSQFPFIRRNGNTYYRSFSLGGLITFFTDIYDEYELYSSSVDDGQQDNVYIYDNTPFEPTDRIFTSKDEVYGASKTLYQNYNEENNINNHEDFIYERAFREKVYKFLYNNDVKLFRSATEGNILVKLMNIGFQPMDSLGRKIYSFTATATEMDENSFSNYLKYNITSQTE